MTCKLSAPGCAPLRLASGLTAYSVKAMVEAAYQAGRAAGNSLSMEDYLLVCLAEESAEVVHAVCKALRFGLDHQWPGRGVHNRDALRDELRDAFRLAERLNLQQWSDLPDKGEKFERMMNLSRSLGRLKP